MSSLKSTLVEFVGPAGVGKSYIHARVMETCIKRGFDVQSLDIKMRSLLRFGFPRSLIAAASLALALRPRSLRQSWRTVKILLRIILASRAVDGNGGVWVWSEGIFHRLRELGRLTRTSDMRWIAETISSHTRFPDVVVVLEGSAAAIYERRVKRGRSGDEFDLTSVEGDVRLVRDSIETIAYIGRTHSPHTKWVCFDVERESTERIVLEIIRLMGKGGPAGHA